MSRLKEEHFLVPSNLLAEPSTDSLNILQSSKTRSGRNTRTKKVELVLNQFVVLPR